VWFALAFALIFLQQAAQCRFSLASLTGWDFLTHLRQESGWVFLRWWIILLTLGVISAAITPFYGSLSQALNRLVGYVAIFIYLYIALYSLKQFGIESIAYWVGLGYIPILGYGIIESLATRGVFWAYQIVTLMRQWVITPFDWLSRVTLLTTEPSFISFQFLLLIALFPFLRSRLLRLSNLALIAISLVFSFSAINLGLIAAYGILLGFFALRPRLALWVSALLGGTAVAGTALYCFLPGWQAKGKAILDFLLSKPSIIRVFASTTIRASYILNLVYVLSETRGLGLGIGQYGLFWKDIYLRHIDYRSFDVGGEISESLAVPEEMRPWSVIFGIGADLGLVGMGMLVAFLLQVFRACQSPHGRAIVVAGTLALVGAYPIVTPHVWLALALMGGVGLQVAGKQE
jgi:hypothetical protein